MAIGKCVMFFVVLTFLWTLNRAGAVDCVLKESCILPCTFRAGDEVVIHWIQVTAGDTPVHSFYHNQDQLSLQNKRFRGRTSLFTDQISRGNASLRLTGAEIQDQGKYKCYTSTITGNQELFINLNVDAPVIKVDIQQVGNRITCSSEGIYPEPELTWSTNPPSSVTLQNKITVHQTEQQLYNINSYLIVSVTDLVYSCTVSTRRNRRRATLFKPTSINSSDTETTIPCTSSNTPLTGLIWRFNHSQIILSQTRANVPYTVSEEWRQQVKSVSESGSLTLQDLSSDQDGIYTCELSDDEETYVTNTFLRTEKSQDHLSRRKAGSSFGDRPSVSGYRNPNPARTNLSSGGRTAPTPHWISKLSATAVTQVGPGTAAGHQPAVRAGLGQKKWPWHSWPWRPTMIGEMLYAHTTLLPKLK